MITSTDLQTIFLIYYDNNPQGYNAAFANAGYAVPANANEAKRFVVAKMYQLYIGNPNKLQGIMAQVPWDGAVNNYTNQQNAQALISAYLKDNVPGLVQNTTGRSADDLKQSIFKNQQTITSVTTTPINTGITNSAIIGISILGVAVVALVIFAARG